MLLPYARLLGALLFLVMSSVISGPFASEPSSDVPSWLGTHVGDGDGQIERVVLERARALYLRKLRAGAIKNPCYFAMDATRPHDLGDGRLGRRFYAICESAETFQAFSAGHGGGRNVKGVADFVNGKRCAKNFGNAMDSKLTTGGAYITRETRTSFKGYYRASPARDVPFVRSFVQFEGEGETANARQRVIGGHPAALLRDICRRKNPGSSYADRDGYVPFGRLEEYAGGRSNGCTSWSPADASEIIGKMVDNPTTLYIYPEAGDIDAVAQAAGSSRPLAKAGSYWNASCLKEIGAPKYWPKETLEPLLPHQSQDEPASSSKPLPLCSGT
jgi:hypothetical protein